MIKTKSLAFRLNIYVVSLIVTISVIILISLFSISSKMLLVSAEDNARNIAAKNINKIDAVINRAAKFPAAIAPVIENNTLNDNQIIELLKSIVNNNDEIYGSAVAYEPYMHRKNDFYFAPYVYKDSGSIKLKYLNSGKYNYFARDWYKTPKSLQKPAWSKPYFDEGGGNILMATYGVPLYKIVNGKRCFAGVLTIDIALNWFEKIVSSVKVYKSGFAFVVGPSGEIITHPNREYILHESISSLADKNNLPGLKEIGRKMINKESGFERIQGISSKAQSRLFYTPFNSNDWEIAIVFPEHELYEDIYNLTWIVLLISLPGLLLIILTISAVMKKLTRPLIELSGAAAEIGAGKFNAILPEVKTSDEVGDLNKSFKRMQEELAVYIENLKRTTSEKERMESELRIAHGIQMGMLPKTFPPYPKREDIDLHAFLEPAKEVGGDLYDFFFTDDDKLVITVGDVSGKGVPASLFMAVTRTLVRSKITKDVCLSSVIDSINEDLKDDNETGLFVTLIVCIINLKTYEIEITNAGHNFPYLISRDGNVQQLKNKNGMALGVFKIKPYTSTKYTLQAGDKLVFYTDGINEAMDSDDNQYDYGRFEMALSKIKDKTARQSTEYILADIRNFTRGAAQSDDMTFLVLQLK